MGRFAVVGIYQRPDVQQAALPRAGRGSFWPTADLPIPGASTTRWGANLTSTGPIERGAVRRRRRTDGAASWRTDRRQILERCRFSSNRGTSLGLCLSGLLAGKPVRTFPQAGSVRSARSRVGLALISLGTPWRTGRSGVSGGRTARCGLRCGSARRRACRGRAFCLRAASADPRESRDAR